MASFPMVELHPPQVPVATAVLVLVQGPLVLRQDQLHPPQLLTAMPPPLPRQLATIPHLQDQLQQDPCLRMS